MEPQLDPVPDQLLSQLCGEEEEGMCMTCVFIPCICFLTSLENRIRKLQGQEEKEGVAEEVPSPGEEVPSPGDEQVLEDGEILVRKEHGLAEGPR